MTPEVLKQIWKRIDEMDISQYEIAKRSGLTQATISRLLSANRGQLSESWQKLLDALGLELTVVEKQDE